MKILKKLIGESILKFQKLCYLPVIGVLSHEIASSSKESFIIMGTWSSCSLGFGAMILLTRIRFHYFLFQNEIKYLLNAQY